MGKRNDLEDLIRKSMNNIDTQNEEDELELNNTPKTILECDGFAFDIEDFINFTPGDDISKHFKGMNISKDNIDKFGEVIKEIQILDLSYKLLIKSIKDQILQKALDISFDTRYSEDILNKILDIKVLLSFCTLCDIPENVKDLIISAEIDKKFAYKPTPRKDSKENEGTGLQAKIDQLLSRIEKTQIKNKK